MTRPVTDKILSHLFKKKKIIFKNKDLDFLKSGTVNDLMYNMVKRGLIQKVTHGVFFFSDLLSQIERHTPELLYFSIIHQDPTWHLGGKSALNYYLLRNQNNISIYTSGSKEFSWSSEKYFFNIKKTSLKKLEDFIYSYRIENYDFRISLPVLILFEILSDDFKTINQDVFKNFIISKKEFIKEKFKEFINRIKLPINCINNFFTLFADSELMKIFDYECYILAQKYGLPTEKYSQNGLFIREKDKRNDLTRYSSEDSYTTGKKLDSDYQQFLLKKLDFMNSSSFDTLVFKTPAGFLRDDYITACMENCNTRWKFWYSFDILDRDIRLFVQNFSMGFGKKIPEFVSEFRKIEPILPEENTIRIELLTVLFKKIVRKYFSQQTLVLIFDHFETIINTETGAFILKLMNLRLNGIRIIIGMDSFVVTDESRNFLPTEVKQFDASSLCFSKKELNTFLNFHTPTKNNQLLEQLNNYVWGIPYFAFRLAKIIDQNQSVPYNHRIMEIVFNDEHINRMILEKLFIPIKTKLEHQILLYLAVSEDCPFSELKTFFNEDDFSSRIDTLCRKFSGYLKFSGNSVTLNPVVSVSIKKYVNKNNRCAYLDFIIKMKKHLEKFQHFRSLMRCSGELIYLNEYTRSLELLYEYREFFLTFGKNDLLLKWTGMIFDNAVKLSRIQRIKLELLRARIFDAKMDHEETTKCLEGIDISYIRNILKNREFHYDLGFCYTSLKKFNKAIKYLNYAIGLDSGIEKNESKIGMDYISIANIETLKRNHEVAKKYFRKAYKCFLKAGDSKHQCFVINNFAEIYYMEKDYRQVIRMYNKALNIAIYQKDMHSAGIIYFNAGIIFQ
ncbi:hypothetical protein KAJ27_07750, partial [bacterium]|nr:hypothetical protein [bacterium]